MVLVLNIESQIDKIKFEQVSFISVILRSFLHHHREARLIVLTARDNAFFEFPTKKVAYFKKPDSNGVSFKLWQLMVLPKMLKNNSVDVFLHLDTSLKPVKNIRNILFLPPNKWLLQKKISPLPALNGYSQIVTPSIFIKKQIEEAYPALAEKMVVITGAATATEKTTDVNETKNKHTDNKEYFLYSGYADEPEELMLMLKAFSLFKKRQQTNRKLVLLHKPVAHALEKINSYKYRDDVVICAGGDTEKESLIAAAYAIIHPSEYFVWGQPVLQAMQYGVPVITLANTATHECCGAAALTFNEKDEQQLAEKMMVLYKDESLHKQLSNAAKEKSEVYNWDNAANQLRKLITDSRTE